MTKPRLRHSFNSLLPLAVVLTLTACGEGQLVQVNNIGGMSRNSSSLEISAETEYNLMTGADLAIQFTDLNGSLFLGTSTTQRASQNPDTLCRKTGAVVPNPSYSYQCWSLIESGASANSEFNALSVSSHYVVNEVGIYGTGIEETVNHDGTELCQKITPVVLNPISSYRCYGRLN